MGTTATTEFAALGRPVHCGQSELPLPRVRVRGRVALSVLLAAAPLMTTSDARAQVWNVEVSGDAVLTFSDNPLFLPPGQEQSDTSLAVRPRVTVSRLGPRLRASSEFGVDLIEHSNEAERNSAVPFARGRVNAEVVDRWLFIDASIDVSRRDANAFAPRGSEVSSFNRRPAATYRLSPRIEHQFGSTLLLRARSDASWVRMPEDTDNRVATLEQRNLRVHREELLIERTPQPLGASVELTSEKSQLAGDPEPLFDQASAKVGVSYGIDPASRMGVFAGRERSRFLLSEDTDSVYGFRLKWAPGPRTALDAEVEKRFFGTGLELGFAHRMPWLAASVRLRRGPATNPFSIQLAGAGNNLATFLDAILTTRYPDPVERGRLVQNMLTNRGLPEALSGAVAVLGKYAQLEQGGNATVVLLGQRNTLTLSAYSLTYRQLYRGSNPIVASVVLDNDNRQRGGNLGFNRRLTPVTAMDISIGYSRADGLAARAGDQTTQQLYGLKFTRVLSPRTTATLGAARRSVETNIGTQPSFQELSAFAGFKHRF